METPAGFTKVSNGQYTKGNNTYVINPTTGEVSARTSSGSEVDDEDLLYLKSYLENKDLTEVMDMSEATFTDPNVIFDMEALEEMGIGSPEPGEEMGYPILYKGKPYLMYFIISESEETEGEEEFSAIVTRVTTRTVTTP